MKRRSRAARAVRAFQKILVANRGEIAVRVCRTLRAMKIPSVAVYSEADRGAPHVRAADEAVAIGPAPPAQSYLDMDAILGAARRAGADGIHPGYGFLSENAAFARRCSEAGVVFIGPSADSMAQLGDKAAARRTAAECRVPLVPGAEDVAGADRARKEAARIGYPVLLKAAGGGGGRGMRLVRDPEEMDAAFDAARREAGAAFGDDRLLLERYVHPARHVEVQILADGEDAIALGERECSLQRRHQKLIEESPSVAIGAKTRSAMQDAAASLARAAGYAGAMTAEFLLGPEERFYFLEVNTRLQVEHPVTEMRSGVDLVRAQIAVAAGESAADSLGAQAPPRVTGHAIEARLLAEDAYHGYLPQTGRILRLDWPEGEGLRIDAGVEAGMTITSHYDSLLAKVIAFGESRESARRRLVEALRATVLLGVVTNQAFLIDLLEGEDFRTGETFTHTVESRAWEGPLEAPDLALAAATAILDRPRTAAGDEEERDRYSPWQRLGPWGRA